MLILAVTYTLLSLVIGRYRKGGPSRHTKSGWKAWIVLADIGYALLTLASLPPFTAGYLAGTIVKAGAWAKAVYLTGYRRGRGL